MTSFRHQRWGIPKFLDGTDFAVEVNGEKLVSGKGETGGANDVDFVLA
ncbi:MAG: hypothetical protein ACRC2S_07910 [Waterburya sp.]